MKTLSAIEALDQAIEMLNTIAKGGAYNVLEYRDKVHTFEQARDGYREQEMKDERNRAAIRALAGRRRTV